MKTLSSSNATGLLLRCAILIGVPTSNLAQPISGRYIAVLRPHIPDAANAAQRLARQFGVEVGYVYQHSICGFAFAGPEQAAQALARNPQIAYVEPVRPKTGLGQDLLQACQRPQIVSHHQEGQTNQKVMNTRLNRLEQNLANDLR